MRRGFTLVELLVAGAMMAVLAGAGYSVIAGGVQASRRAHASGAAVAHAQQALAAMAADIRSAVARGDVRMTALDARYEDLDADTIDFLIPAPGRRSEDPRTGGIYEVGYYVDNDPATDARWLLRRTDTTLDDDPLEGGNVRPAGAGVSELNLEFYDGSSGRPAGARRAASRPPCGSASRWSTRTARASPCTSRRR